MDIQLTEKLIEAVKKRPVLYSNSHPFIRNKLWQQEAWREIELELNNDVSFLKKKWNYLKSTYTQFKRFQRIANNSPTPKRVKLSHWAWGKYMSFLDEDFVYKPHGPLNETQTSEQQFSANEEDSDNSTSNDTPISSPHREETVKIESSPEPSSALVKNKNKRYSRGRRIDSNPKVGEEEESEDDTPISSPYGEETVKIETSPEPSSALIKNKNKRYSRGRRIDSNPKVGEEEESEDDTPISSPYGEETVKIETSPEPISAMVKNTKKRYSRGRRINLNPKVREEEDNAPISSPHEEETVKIESSPEPSSALAENTKKIYSEKRRIDLDPKVEKEQNDEDRTMRNIQKSTSIFDNSYNSEKVEVNCDAVDLFFLGYAATFKRLSRKKRVLVKFEIAKAFMEAELDDISNQ